MPAFATTVTQLNLQASFAARWVRPIWYQPGATIQFDDGFAFPITRRLFKLPQSANVTIIGRVAVEYGDEASPPGASDLARKGPALVYNVAVNNGAPINYIAAGKRTLRIDRVVFFENYITTSPSVRNSWNLLVGLQLAPIGAFSGIASVPIPMDSDAIRASPPGATALTASAAFTTLGGGPTTTLQVATVAIPLSAQLAAGGFAKDVNFGDDGPSIYPIGADGAQTFFQIQGNNGSMPVGDAIVASVYCHEELF